MSFTYPWVLAALALPVILMVHSVAGRRTTTVVPFDHSVKSGRSGIVLRGLIQFAELLPAALLAVVVLILAGPQALSSPKTKRVLTNIEFCVDVSGSMNASFGEGTRYDASMAAINEFLDFREGDAFGLTFFGNEVLHWVPLTSDPSAVRCAPPFMNPRNPGHPPWLGGTAIGKALVACRKILVNREEGDRMIVLVSDGVSFDLNNGNDMDIAKRLSAEGIVVYAIHIGGGDAPDPVVNITSFTGGEVFAPGDPEALKRVFKRIDEMQGTRLEKATAEIVDWFEPYCVAGSVLLALSLLCSFGLRYTPW